MKNSNIYGRSKIQETLYTGQRHLGSLQSRAPWDLTQFSQHLFYCSTYSAKSFVRIAISFLILFPESHWQCEISSLSKVILVLGKDRSCRVPNLGYRGVESPEWSDVSQKKLCTRCDAWACVLLWWSCQSPDDHGCGLVNHPNGFHEKCSSLIQNLMQSRCSTHSVILNAMTTQYRCSLKCIYHPHWLVQWSHHCSCMYTPVHSPWLPSYINVSQTILIILTIVLFL